MPLKRIRDTFQGKSREMRERMQQLFLSLQYNAQEQVVSQMGELLSEVMRRWPIGMQHVRSLFTMLLVIPLETL